MENEYTELIIGYLQNSLTREETDRFYTWVNENTSNKKLFFEVKAIYDAGLPLSSSQKIAESWERLLAKRKKSQSRHFNLWYRIASYAAVALLAVAISSAYFFFIEEEEYVYTKYIGGDGLEADVVELPDGTHVSLGSKTTFHYDKNFGKDKRIVYLEGEAYFDVAKQKDKPFIVKTKEQDIEALGTKFNVMAYPLDSLVVTTLSEGSVRLTSLNMAHPTILKPDQQLIYNRNTKKSYLQDVDAQQYSSWTSGYYYFPQQSLQAILDRLSHVYGIQFTVNSEALNKRTFTGTFYRGQSIKDIMDIINLSIPIRYKIDDHHVTISEK
ncbi:DUF4974 domain-containing protein [Parabacteroides sp. W1-Q-101]|uniref:FecR family protein n=1 Tax=Parabacteroides TaxID=375288 RepID=UPI002030C655|nr:MULTISPECIES: FecR domain-containing protein [Parabacteroides]MCM0718744.1 DUF4974 domain-containing protein [Parabacteroides sp. W1-Q-101]